MAPPADDSIRFEKEFTRQEPISGAAISRATELMSNGRLHRYNTASGEIGEAALLEQEYAAYVGARYCVGLSSCGSAIYVALKSAGVQPGDTVLCTAFTLAPVPGSIENAGARPVFVEITEDYLTDLDDLERKAGQSNARFLLLSHMRGHIADMNRVVEICSRRDIVLIEDCAHTAGCRWQDQFTGTFGAAGCFSTQTYKHLNSGEGGLLVTDDDDIAARAILYSGSYMLYDRHVSRPPLDVFERYRKVIPNFSLRMSNLVAAVIRPQLAELDQRCRQWNERYDLLAMAFDQVPWVRVPPRSPDEGYVGSSLQFSLVGVDHASAELFVRTCRDRGVEVKWFGKREPEGFTSSWESWQYVETRQELPRTREILDFLCDFRIPLTFSLDDCRTIAAVIGQVAEQTFA
jgi:dTDP-4-amino-4,6-dideoxygalactose transaminase